MERAEGILAEGIQTALAGILHPSPAVVRERAEIERLIDQAGGLNAEERAEVYRLRVQTGMRATDAITRVVRSRRCGQASAQ